MLPFWNLRAPSRQFKSVPLYWKLTVWFRRSLWPYYITAGKLSFTRERVYSKQLNARTMWFRKILFLNYFLLWNIVTACLQNEHFCRFYIANNVKTIVISCKNRFAFIPARPLLCFTRDQKGLQIVGNPS